MGTGLQCGPTHGDTPLAPPQQRRRLPGDSRGPPVVRAPTLRTILLTRTRSPRRRVGLEVEQRAGHPKQRLQKTRPGQSKPVPRRARRSQRAQSAPNARVRRRKFAHMRRKTPKRMVARGKWLRSRTRSGVAAFLVPPKKATEKKKKQARKRRKRRTIELQAGPMKQKPVRATSSEADNHRGITGALTNVGATVGGGRSFMLEVQRLTGMSHITTDIRILCLRLPGHPCLRREIGTADQRHRGCCQLVTAKAHRHKRQRHIAQRCRRPCHPHVVPRRLAGMVLVLCQLPLARCSEQVISWQKECVQEAVAFIHV